MGDNNGCGVLPSFGFPGMHGHLRRVREESFEPQKNLAEEVAKLRETVEEMVYWMRPQMGQIVTGKADVEEFERLMGRNP